MSIFNMVGCGGSSLNYEVVGGTSAPSSPSVNTIWINTSTTITSHIFSATQPTNPASGMVWITVGASSTVAFSATEENPVMVYPISAKQYVGGAWVDVEAKSFQNGVWVDWIRYLLRKNDLYAGWSVLSPVSFVTETKGIRITRNGSFGYCYYSEMVDIRNYNTVNIKFSECTSLVGAQLCIGKKLFTSEADEISYAESAKALQNGSLQIDLSGFKSYGTVSIGIGVHGGNGSILAEEVWFE